MRLGRLRAFIKRDFLIEISYRTSFILQILSIVSSVLIFYFIATIADVSPETPGLDGVEYFAYLVVNLAFFSYLSSAIMSCAGKIRTEQTTGTLEAMLVTPTPTSTIILGSSLWEFLLPSVKVIAYLVIGGLLSDIGIRPGGLLPGLFILALTVLAVSGIGVLSAAFILYLKRGDPITYLVTSGSALLGGVLYPPEAMPPLLEWGSRLLPVTYGLRALRRALLLDAPWSDLWPDIWALILFAVVLLPLGILAFRVAIRKARQEGSLVQY
jgi:ABC-2 type transport system permease protein